MVLSGGLFKVRRGRGGGGGRGDVGGFMSVELTFKYFIYFVLYLDISKTVLLDFAVFYDKCDRRTFETEK